MTTPDRATDATGSSRQPAPEALLEAAEVNTTGEDASHWFGFESVHPLTWVPPPAWGCGGVA